MCAVLIERLEKATGPDRELDLDIARLQGVTVMRRNWDDTANVEHTFHHYTESFDSARSLVPAGFYWLVSEGRTRDTEPLGGAQVFRPNYLVEPIAQAEHESAVIALCIAALKARAALTADKQEGEK
jgi:hypothetical protein